jgi:hypothetical protein
MSTLHARPITEPRKKIKRLDFGPLGPELAGLAERFLGG